MYRERMTNYYPKVIQSILEFQAIITAEHPEFKELENSNERVLSDAYLLTMTEDRIKEWENMLGIQPVEGSTVDDRRETIVARIRAQGKLNTAMINNIVGTFTGGTADSWIENNTLYVKITPPPNNKSYRFENVEQELAKKIPAHLGFEISRNYYTWEDINNNYSTWNDVNTNFLNWESVLLGIPLDLNVITIIVQPTDQTAADGSTTTFKIVAVGNNISEYRWMYKRSDDDPWYETSMTGYNTDTLTVNVISSRNGYKYKCRVFASDYTFVDSDFATLYVS